MRSFCLTILLFFPLILFAQHKQFSAESDSLFAMGVELYKQGKYEEAIPNFEKCREIDLAVLDSTDARRDYSSMWLASCYYQLGDSVKASGVYEYYRLVPVDRRLTVTSDSLMQAGLELYNKQNYQGALDLFLKTAEIEKQVVGDGHIWYGNTISNIGCCCFLLNKYAEAIYFETEALAIFEEVLGKENPRYATSLNYLAEYNSALGNYAKAIRLSTEALNISEKVLGKEHPSFASSLNNLAYYNFLLGNYSEAIRLGTEALNIREKVLGKEHPDYAISLSNLAGYNASLGNYAEAIHLGTVALNILEKMLGKEHPDYAMSLNNLASYNSSLGNYSEAIRLGTEALNIRGKVLGKEHPDYATSLSILASDNFSLGNYSEAVRLETEALNIYVKVLGKAHSSYATSLNNLAGYNSSLGNYSEAIRLGTEALNIREKVLGKEHPDYATSLNNLADYNSSLGNYSEAIRLGTEALNIREKVLGKEHPDYAISLSNLAGYNASLGNYAEAIHLGTVALNILEKMLGKEHPDYAMSLNNLASYNSSLGNYSEAIRLGTEALNIRGKVLGKEHPDYATSLGNLASDNCSLGNYSESIRLETEALNIREKVLGKEHLDYATSLSNLAGYNALFGNFAESIHLGTEALNILEKVLGKGHPDYATLLSNMAGYNALLGNYAEAIRLEAEALNIRKKVFGDECHPDYALSLSKSANYASLFGYYAEAIQLETISLNILEKVFGKKHPNYAISLSNLSVYTWLSRSPKVAEYCVKATQLGTEIVRSTFSDLIAMERNLFWNKYKVWFENAIHAITYDFPSDSLSANGYNGILMSKGLLLNSEIELSTLLRESGDEEVEKLYNELRMLRLQLNKLYEKPIAEKTLDTDSLERVTQGLERELVQRSKVYGDFTKNLAIDWKQVQQKLGDKDLAVEFISFPVRNDSVMYTAYCLRKGMAAPKMYPLFERKQLERLRGEELYNTTAVGELVWRPLEEELQGVENVYFAPAGELYNIAIESVPYWEGEGWMSDHWNFYRLSSTRELALIKDEKSVNEAALYGGLEYDTDVTAMVNDSRKYPAKSRSMDFSLYNLADSLGLREGVKFLPGSKVEAEEINKYMLQTMIHPTLFTDTVGTETSFKALAGKRIRLMHISTHGFYWTESEVKGLDNMLSFLSVGNKQNQYVEDKAMTRSGLLFAGANNALEGKRLPENVDDGILTAQEISRLDLRGLDIAVLSACQTGLGEITGDGVFGLQRGFKKAGANTLLISLWSVHDDATRLLMTRFYADLISGMGKAEALRDAQRYVREYEREREVFEDDGRKKLAAKDREEAQMNEVKKVVIKERPYQDPAFWAAFVLLDGIN